MEGWDLTGLPSWARTVAQEEPLLVEEPPGPPVLCVAGSLFPACRPDNDAAELGLRRRSGGTALLKPDGSEHVRAAAGGGTCAQTLLLLRMYRLYRTLYPYPDEAWGARIARLYADLSVLTSAGVGIA